MSSVGVGPAFTPSYSLNYIMNFKYTELPYGRNICKAILVFLFIAVYELTDDSSWDMGKDRCVFWIWVCGVSGESEMLLDELGLFLIKPACY